MPPDNFAALEWLTKKLERVGCLDPKDRARIALLPAKIESVPRFHRVVREGEEHDHCCLLVEGVASRHKHTVTGARQIVSFHVKGDLLDTQHLLLSRADHSVETMTPAVLAWIPKPELLRLAWERPQIGRALWRDTLVDASVFREWILNVGQRDAKTRIAHMLCEFAARCEAAGLGPPSSLKIPFTQADVADATGLTSVHINRMIQELREEGALSKDTGQIRIHNFNRMRAIGNFDPAYLHAA